MNEAQQRADHKHRLMSGADHYKQQVSSGDFRLPRTRWSHMDDDEFLRFTEFEPASEELMSEMRARLTAQVR